MYTYHQHNVFLTVTTTTSCASYLACFTLLSCNLDYVISVCVWNYLCLDIASDLHSIRLYDSNGIS